MTSEGRHSVIARMPVSISVAPGPYVIYLMVNGVPAMGQAVIIETTQAVTKRVPQYCWHDEKGDACY